MQTLLVSTGTASASAMYTFHSFAFLQLFLGYTADTRRAKVGIARLNTSQTAELLKTRLPEEREWSGMILCKVTANSTHLSPLCNEIRICVFVLHKVIIQFPRDCFTLVVEIVDIS